MTVTILHFLTDEVAWIKDFGVKDATFGLYMEL